MLASALTALPAALEILEGRGKFSQRRKEHLTSSVAISGFEIPAAMSSQPGAKKRICREEWREGKRHLSYSLSVANTGIELEREGKIAFNVQQNFKLLKICLEKPLENHNTSLLASNFPLSIFWSYRLILPWGSFIKKKTHVILILMCLLLSVWGNFHVCLQVLFSCSSLSENCAAVHINFQNTESIKVA